MRRQLLTEARELEIELKENGERLSPNEARERKNLIDHKRQNAKQIERNMKRTRPVPPGKKPLTKEEIHTPYWAPRRKPPGRFFG